MAKFGLWLAVAMESAAALLLAPFTFSGRGGGWGFVAAAISSLVVSIVASALKALHPATDDAALVRLPMGDLLRRDAESGPMPRSTRSEAVAVVVLAIWWTTFFVVYVAAAGTNVASLLVLLVISAAILWAFHPAPDVSE